MPPLDGYHVLDLSLLLPGPLSTQILRDLGARVTKIEPPSPGDYMAHWPPMVGDVAATYHAINRGKERLSLDLRNDDDRARFFELIPTADVLVEGFRPGVIDRLGIGYDVLREINPRIVLCSISGYGQDGPLAQRAGHDLNYQALAGVLSLSGDTPSARPNPQLQVADTAAGSYAAAMLVLAALLERERTGRGRHVDVSMSEQLLPLMSAVYATAGALDRDPASDGELLSGGVPCYKIYKTAEGGAITIGALEPKFWHALVTALGRPELAEVNHMDPTASAAVTDSLAALFRSRTLDEWVQLLHPADACVEPVLSLAEVRRHPQWQARGSFERLPTPDGRQLEVPRMPGSLAGFGRD